MAKNFFNTLIVSALCIFMLSCAESGKRLQPSAGNIPFNMPAISLPSIPANEVVLTDFGAVGDGKTLCTEAFE